MLPPLKPIPIKDRLSVVFVEQGRLDVLDGAFVVVDKNGVRTHIPVGSVACLMLEPGTRVSHAAVVLAARVGLSCPPFVKTLSSAEIDPAGAASARPRQGCRPSAASFARP
jgi:hypothetical protein